MSAKTRGGRRGIAMFLNAGDPCDEVMRELVMTLDREGVQWLELAVPFPNSPTDGPVIRRSADRALARGADLRSTLAFLAAIRPRLERLKVALLVDWRQTVKSLDLDEFLTTVRRAGCDGLLVHGVPPAARRHYYERAHRSGQPIVTTCYASSTTEVRQEAAANASAFLYLVSHWGRSESVAGPDCSELACVIEALRTQTAAPIGVGFGIRNGHDARTVWEAGADLAIVGSACVACIERTATSGEDPDSEIRALVHALRTPGEPERELVVHHSST